MVWSCPVHTLLYLLLLDISVPFSQKIIWLSRHAGFPAHFKSLYPIISPLTSQVMFVPGKIQGFFSNNPKQEWKIIRKKNLSRKGTNLLVVTKLLKENRYSVVLIKKDGVKIRIKLQNKQLSPAEKWCGKLCPEERPPTGSFTVKPHVPGPS